MYIGVIIPLLLVLYFTFKTSMDRVADADRHVAQVNRLYLSTIETLAMAIDAKDQVTHGHIRRVQRYAVGLAERLGVTDNSLLKALEAAALLHDMGKLAVPEHILNKPGRLTPAEFEKMKLHASVGADILSSIEFPYPVVPIVRHHHESWDGTGYPDGLKGTEIPIGARILSVVDCFDALTSHRPYRPQLQNEQALEILRSRSGSMYDPLIVQTFERVYSELEVERESFSHVSSRAPMQVPSSRATHSSDNCSASVTIPADTADLVRRQLGTVEADAAVLFSYDSKADEIVGSLTMGPAADGLIGMRIPVGQRLSGWVAANRQAIVNSDAALDLCGEDIPLGIRLRNCLSVPLVLDGDLLGVVTLYSCEAGVFANEHVRKLEDAARRIACVLSDLEDRSPVRVPLVS
jgi:putative nucleotidyltransferase with HDIG domain